MKYNKSYQADKGKMAAMAGENIFNIRVIKTFANENQVIR